MIGELVLVDYFDFEKVEFDLFSCSSGFSMYIYVDDEHTLEKQLKNRKSFDYCMNYIEKKHDEDITEEKDFIIKNFDNLLDSVDSIRLKFSKQDYMEFIKKNPIVLAKDIVFDESLEITDYDRLMELMDICKGKEDNVYVYLNGNKNIVSLKDCYKTMNAIRHQAYEVKQLGLSPMETIMYVYDLVRSRVYTSENETDFYFQSRDLSKVLFGDKIVCLGYANIFKAILQCLGIQNFVVLLHKKGELKGHARNIIYVKDDKYDIDGIYYFDPTWDSKRKNETNEYLSRYKFFAKTKKQIDDYEKNNYEDKFLPMYSENMNKKIEQIIETKKFEDLEPYSKTLRNMYSLVTPSNLMDDIVIELFYITYGLCCKKPILCEFDSLFSKFNKELSAETMLRVFNNVRKIQYYQNSKFYPYSFIDLYKTCIMSDWKFAENHMDRMDKFMQSIYKHEGRYDNFYNFRTYASEANLFQDIEKVTVAKVLRLVYDKKSKEK